MGLLMKKIIAAILALSMLMCLGCAGPSSDADNADNANASVQTEQPQKGEKPAKLNKVAGVKRLSNGDYSGWATVRDNNPVIEDSTAAITAFAAKASAAVLSGNERNVNFSPFSLYFALSMAACGADGGTAEEMLGLLGAGEAKELAKQCGNIYRVMLSKPVEGKNELILADSLWLSDSYQGQKITYSEDFLKTCADEFYSEVYSADFSGTRTAEAMSKWISDKTRGALKPSFEPNPEQFLSIISTLYLKDEWTDRFDSASTAEDTFTKADGSKVKCDFMNAVKSQGFHRGENYTAASLSLKNYGSMTFILPDEGVTTDELLASGSIFSVTNGEATGYGMVTFKIPKFAFDSSFDLVEPLRSLGMERAFDMENADFSNMCDIPAAISSIKQDTHIAIDENGVVASAFTKIDYCGAGMPQENADMILTRPFIYIISNNGMPLFVGVIADPSIN